MGVLIGLEREYRAKEAGYRTHFLVALGSALMMIVSQYGLMEVLKTDLIRLDPSRIAAQVVSGIGFIGAGTIILQKQIVRGLTTAAGIWATSGIGLAVGAGMYAVGISATLLVLLGLETLSYFFKSIGLRNMMIDFFTDDKEVIKRVSKKTKGGNQIHFTALVVSGDKISRVGVGLGKAKSVAVSVGGARFASIPGVGQAGGYFGKGVLAPEHEMMSASRNYMMQMAMLGSSMEESSAEAKSWSLILGRGNNEYAKNVLNDLKHIS